MRAALARRAPAIRAGRLVCGMGMKGMQNWTEGQASAGDQMADGAKKSMAESLKEDVWG